MKELLLRIVSFDSFRPVFAELAQVDERHTQLIKTALNKATNETHTGLREAGSDSSKLRYWLYRESVELKAHSSSYLSYAEMMASREANLWKFALTITDQFFSTVFDALDSYFETKKRLMLAECDANATWYSSIADSSKKLLVPINLLKTALDETGQKFGINVLPKGQVAETNSIVEGLLSTHLSPKYIQADVASILEAASQRLAEVWRKQIQSQAPDLSSLKVFATHSADVSSPTIAFEMGAAEQTFAVGIAGGIAGVVGLAAGWHTLTYALINVFPPVAVFSIVAAIGIAVLRKEAAAENRKSQISEAVKQYHRQLLLHMDSQQLGELNGQTLREAISEQNQKIVTQTLNQWQAMISGQLRVDHYRLLMAATTSHLLLVEEALKSLDNDPQSGPERRFHDQVAKE